MQVHAQEIRNFHFGRFSLQFHVQIITEMQDWVFCFPIIFPLLHRKEIFAHYLLYNHKIDLS
jgi:hypothetical protein